VAVVAVDAPGVQNALEIDQLVTRAAQVVHDLLGPFVDEGAPDAGGDVVEGLIPRDALPLAAAAWPDPPERMADALGVGDLVERGRPLGAGAPPAPRVGGVALELLDLQRVLVHVGQETAGRLAVEADGGQERVAALDPAGPGLRVVFLPVVPALDRREAPEPAGGRGEVAGGGAQRLGG
jgi:hypothetical protein